MIMQCNNYYSQSSVILKTSYKKTGVSQAGWVWNECRTQENGDRVHNNIQTK